MSNQRSAPAPVKEYFARAFDSLQGNPNAAIDIDDELRSAYTASGWLLSGHEVAETPNIEPAGVICPPGTTGSCWREEHVINGKVHWVWVCDCNPV